MFENVYDTSDVTLAILFIIWLFFSTFATVGRFFCTNDASIVKQCTEDKIVVVKDNIIQCKVLDKKVLSGSEQMIMNLKEDYG